MGLLSQALLNHSVFYKFCILNSHSQYPVPFHEAKPPSILLIYKTLSPEITEIYFTFSFLLHAVPIYHLIYHSGFDQKSRCLLCNI